MTLGLGLRTRMREVGSSTPASVLHAKSQTLEPTAAVEPSQHCAKVHGGSRRPPAFAAESLEPISCSPTTVSVTVAVQSHVQVQARTAMARGKQQEASKPSATSQLWAAATRWGAKGPSIVGEGVKTRPLARGRARGGMRSAAAVTSICYSRVVQHSTRGHDTTRNLFLMQTACPSHGKWSVMSRNGIYGKWSRSPDFLCHLHKTQKARLVRWHLRRSGCHYQSSCRHHRLQVCH